MRIVLHPAFLLLIAIACVVAGVSYFHQYLHMGTGDPGAGGVACGFLVMGGAALLSAAYLHKKP